MRKITFMLIMLLVATISYSQVLIDEDFNGTTLPAGWSTNAIFGNGVQVWTFGSGVVPGVAGFTSNAAIFSDDAAGNTGNNDHAQLFFGPLDVSGMSNLVLSYKYAHRVVTAGSETLKVEIWNNVANAYITLVTYDTTTSPTTDEVDISAALAANPGINPSSLFIAFRYNDIDSNWGYGSGVDDVVLKVAVPNDSCVNAITVPVNAAGTGCTSPTIANNVGATDSSGTNGTPACGSFAGGDVWFEFIAPPSGDIKVIVPVVGEWSSFATAVYDSCSTTTELACEVNFNINNVANIPSEVTYTGLTPGDIYLLRAWDHDNNSFGEVSFCIEEIPVPAPANDSCVNAITVPVNAAGTGCTSPTIANNVGATDSSGTNGTPACGSFAGGDVWFEFIAPASGDIKVIVPVVGEWSSFATAVYDSCSTTTELACEVNFEIFNTANVPSEVTYIGLTPGASYILRAWDFSNNDFGEVSFCIEEILIPAPPNDFCLNAITVPVNAAGTGCTTPTIASNVGATDSSGTNGTPACGNFAGADIWFEFTAPPTGDIKVIVPVVGEWSSFATAVYDVCAGGGVPELACKVNLDINNAANIPSEVTYTDLTPGASYILRAWDFNGNDFGEVSFCIEEFDSTVSVVEDTIEGLTLYPNPIKDVLKVTAQDEISKITVFNLLGQEVKSINPIANNFSIDLSNLNTGIYIVKLISTDNKKSTRKIVKK